MTRNLSQPSSDLLSEAAHWHNDRLAGDMFPGDELAFEDWLARSPAHRKAYETVARGWLVAGGLDFTPQAADVEEPQKRKPKWFIWAAMAASLLVGVTISQGAWPLLSASDKVELVQNFVTTTGQRSVVTLPDGTRVTLDSETEFRFRDQKAERSVDLVKGRAFFDVAKNPDRPFVVHVEGKEIKALGTMFEVSMNGDVVSVVLAEGKVRVDDTKRRGSAELLPGRQLVMRADTHWTLRNVDVKKEMSWTDGRLIFMSDPLSQAVVEVNRYSNRKIVFEGGQTPAREIVGIFSAGDVDGFVKALELNGIAHQIASTHDQILLQSTPVEDDVPYGKQAELSQD